MIKSQLQILFVAILFFSNQAYSQTFTENFNGIFPPTATVTVTNPIGTGTSDPNEVPAGQVRWYRSDNTILTTTVPGFTPNAGLNPGRGATGFSAVFDSWAISTGGKADLIFNNINLSSLSIARLRFYLKNTDGTDVVKVYVRKTNTWVQVGLSSYGIYADWTAQTILLNAYSGPGNDTVDIRFEGTSNNFGSNYGLDDVSIDEAPAMSFDSTSAYQITGDVYQSYTRQQILRIEVSTSGSTPALTASQFNFNTSGTTNTNDIKNACLFYTSSSSTFDSTVKVGNVVATPNGAFSFTPATAISLDISASKNYFWLCYDIKPTATINNVVDAEFVSAVIGGVTRTPLATNPSGNRTIKAPVLIITVPNSDGNSSSSGRGPVSASVYQRSSALYTKTELNSLNLGATISSISYNIVSVSNKAVSGNIKLYVANTTDVSFTRSTTWTSLISSPTAMKLVYTGPLTVPNTTGWITIPFDSSFVYSGNGLYVAFEWEITSSLATSNSSYDCNLSSTAIIGQGQKSAVGSSSLPSTLTSSSSLRPVIRIETPQEVLDASVRAAFAQGQTPFGGSNSVSALIKNYGATELVNYPVTLTVRGSNAYTNTKFVNLPSLTETTVNFDNYPVPSQGADTAVVSVGSDNNSLNNDVTVLSDVTADKLNYCYNSVADGTAGFGTGSGILLSKYTISNSKFIRTIDAFISNSASNIGKSVFGVVMDANGNIIARTDTITLSGTQINKYISFNVNERVVISNNSFYIGLAQLANAQSYLPLGTQTELPLRASTYYTSTINGSSLTTNSTFGRYMIGCTVEDVLPAIIPNLGVNRDECIGYVLNAGVVSNNYLWSTGATTSSIVINSDGLYTVAIDNGQGIVSTDTVILNVHPIFTPSVSITKTPNTPVCFGTPITFTAESNDTLLPPIYEWYVNSTLVKSSNSPIFVSTTVNQGDSVWCVFNPNSICATVPTDTSNILNISISGTPSTAKVDITSNVGLTICSGTSVTFTATPQNGGTTPLYQWFLNGVSVPTATSNVFVRNGLTNGTKVSVRMTSNSECLIGNTVVLDTVTMVVNTKPVSAYTATQGSNGTYSFTNSTTSSLSSVTYKWTFGDGGTSTLKNPSHKYTTPGIYAVKLVSKNTCGSDSITKNLNVVIVGVESEINVQNIQVYPNPTNDILNIELALNTEDHLKLEVYSITGQLVKSIDLGTLTELNTTLDLSDLNSGIYHIRILGENTSTNRRIQLN